MSQRNARVIGGIYQLGQALASGASLSIYTAYNRNTSDVVGLTVIESPPAFDLQAVQHMLQPLERRRAIGSPNVIRVYDWGFDDSRIYIATDPPRGVTLRHVLDNENVDLERSMDLLRQMARGLQALHDGGIAGLDLRPLLITVDTIAVTDRVQLDDIGLRTLLKRLGYADSQRPEDIGFLDARYAPPEYINGGQVGPWSDVYQLGLLLFEMVTGRVPFVGKNFAETGILQSTDPVPRMAQFKHDTPAALQQAVECALAKQPAARFANAGVFLSTLESIQMPARRYSSAAWPGAGGRPTSSPGQGQTGELPAVDRDIAQSATLIGASAAAARTTGQPVQSTPAPGVYAFLCYELDGVERQRFALTKRDNVVGRSDPKRGLTPDIDLTAVDGTMTVSRQHARIRYEETFFYMEDLKSHNKTRLGELPLAPLKPELLQHGDVVRFGSVRLIFRVPGMPDRPPLKESKI